MNEYTPTTKEMRTVLVYLNLCKAEDQGDVDLAVVKSETVAQFDRMIAEVERAAAVKALTAAAGAVDAESTVWVADETNPRGGAYWDTNEWLRTRAAAYRREETE